MFTILKDVAGVWWHLYNNNATKVHLSDFDVIIEAVSETYVIEAKNGSNIPSQAISISDIRVIDESISTTIPIAFSGATGLIELLTSLGYPPYLSNAPSQPPVKVYTKGQTAFFTNITQAWIDANFDNTGLGILEAIGWEKVPELDGKVPIGQTTGGLFDNIGNSYGFANTVLVAHEHDSIEYSNGKKGVNTGGKGATVAGHAIAENNATDKIDKTSKVGQDHTGAPSTIETGANKNYQPSLIVLYVRRTTDLWIMGGSGMAQNLAQTLAIDNKTNNIPIVSNNGKASVYVNDAYISLNYNAQTFAMSGTEVQLYSEAPVTFDSNVSTDFNTPVLKYNNLEVATQNWVASQGYGTVTPSTLISTDADNALAVGTDSKLFVPIVGGGVESVTGADVDNTDPLNPFVNPTPIDASGGGTTINDGVIEHNDLVALGSLTANNGRTKLDANRYDTEVGLYEVSSDKVIATYSQIDDKFYYAGFGFTYDVSNGLFEVSGSISGYVKYGVDDPTTVVLTSSDLNTNYPASPIGFKVYCVSIIVGAMVYEKTPSGWIGTACIIP